MKALRRCVELLIQSHDAEDSLKLELLHQFYVLGASVLSISYLFYLTRDLDDPTKELGKWNLLLLKIMFFDQSAHG
jgi:hypothetical protein